MIKAGIIGLGKMGQAHAEWIIGSPDMALTAICEKQAERAAILQQKYQAPVYNDIDEFLKSSDVELVVVVTTNDTHERIVVSALEAGKHVVVEKPMAMTYESAQRMVAAAKKSGRKLTVHQSSRWDRDYYLVRDVIKSGTIGEVLSIQSKAMFCDTGWPSWGIDGMANPWRIKARFGGGMLYDWGPHLIDQMMQLMGGSPKSVFGRLQISGVWGNEVDDGFFAVLDFGNKAICQIECSNNAKLDMPRWYVMGTAGTLIVEGKHEPVWDKATLTCVDVYQNQRTEEIKIHGVHESGMEGDFYRDLIPFLEGKNDGFVNMEDVAKVVRVMEMIAESSRTGETVKW